MNKPRVLIFSLAYFQFVGGAEIAVKEITDRLGGFFDFDLITLRFNKNQLPKENIGNINIFRVGGGKFFFPLRSFFLARKLNKENRYKIVWSIMAAYAGFGALFFKFFNPKISFLLTLQEGDSEKHILKRVGIFYPLWKQIFKKADYIQAISNYLADFARRYGAKCPLEVVPNGVDLDKFSIFNFQFSNKNPNVKTIITTSRLVYKNGVDILIKAVAELKAKSYQLKAIIVGDGPDRSKLEKLTIDLNIKDRIKFIGHVDPEEIPKHLAEANVFVRPSRSEGLGISFLEAMAAGLPVIATSVGGIPDFLKNHETGLFCNVDDPSDLAQKIRMVFDNDELYRRLSENGRELVESKYSWDPIASRMSEIFKLTTNHKLQTKKLLLATGIYPPEIGGPATYAALLEKELPKRKIEVTVLPFRAVRNWPVGIRHFFYFIKALALCFKHDLVLAQDTISVGLPSLLAAKLSRKKFIIRVPGDYVWEQSVQRFGVKDSIDDFQNKRYSFKVELLRSIQKFVVNNADTVITPSNYFRDLVRGWVKNKDKVITIYNGIDLKISNSPYSAKASQGGQFLISKQTPNPKPSYFTKASQDRQTLNPKTIVSVGRLVPWKGFDMLIEMMCNLPDWKLIIIGDGPERETLKSQIINHKLQDRIKLTGAIPRESVLGYLRNSDIFILNTHFESFSYQIVEAMASGIPVITTNIGNISEIIRNGTDGVLVKPNDISGFINAIKKIEVDTIFRDNLVSNALERSKDFSIEKTLNNLMSILKQ